MGQCEGIVLLAMPCLNYDLGLSLTLFYGKVKDGKMLEQKMSWKFLEILALELVNTVVLMSI